MIPTEQEIFQSMFDDPLVFIEIMWGLTPERDNKKFVKGKNITWQQHDLFIAVKEAIQGKAKKRISITSGHGTGKGAAFSMLILWYMYTRRDCQIACTAPNADQMHSVLWKEVAIWKDLMPQKIKEKFEWTRDYIRFAERPETWFARARTARKENPEALAGIHGEHVMILADEASGVPDPIFHTAEGALTGEDYLMIMGSQPTRTSGYFYDAHHSDKENWQCLEFDSEESPLHTKDSDYISRIINKNGVDSDEYAIRVKGKFPRSDIVDDKGYASLLSEVELKYTYDEKFNANCKLGIDPAGEGNDCTSWVVRDNFKAMIVAVEKISSPKSILQTTRMIMDKYNIKPEDVYLDSFGIGTNVAQEFAQSGLHVNCVNVGDSPVNEKDLYLNRRAQMYWLLRNWIRQSGELFYHKGWKELLTIKYTREIKGRIQLMSKKTMKSLGYNSPNHADALALTFLDGQHIVFENYRNQEMNFTFNSLGQPQLN